MFGGAQKGESAVLVDEGQFAAANIGSVATPEDAAP